ncbi:MAG: hypothetical protein EKK62_09615 [Acidimicrobiia bacterium]|nr:MAG: hypothetical protein EKK62_09615 [Acidimicrobiia bacterium]
MIYVFEHPQTGERVERDYRMGTAPQKIRVGRRTFRRAIGLPMLRVPSSEHFECTSLPTNYEPALKAGATCDPKTGRIRFSSRAQVLKTIAEAKAMGDTGIVYNEAN